MAIPDAALPPELRCRIYDFLPLEKLTDLYSSISHHEKPLLISVLADKARCLREPEPHRTNRRLCELGTALAAGGACDAATKVFLLAEEEVERMPSVAQRVYGFIRIGKEHPESFRKAQAAAEQEEMADLKAQFKRLIERAACQSEKEIYLSR